MLYLVAMSLPPLAMLFVGRPFLALFALALQLTLIGWIPAAVWALLIVNDYKAEQRAKKYGRRT